MKCIRCAENLTQEESFDHFGHTLCEDCYMAALQPPRPCDPAAVSSAVATRNQLGHKGSDGLTKRQKDIYERQLKFYFE